MRKRTTTQKLHEAITNNLLQVTKVEIHHKSSKQVDILSVDSLKKSLEFLTETIFKDMIDWHYERDSNADGQYIIDSGAMNSNSEIIIAVYMSICNGANEEAVERTLLFTEEE